MAFTIEDGTGVEDANAYIAVAFADTYFTERNIASWVGSVADKEVFIIRATDYIEKVNALRFRGRKEFPETPQGLSFPRLSLRDRDGRLITGIPVNLMRATAEYANRAIAGTLMPDPAVVDSTGLDVVSSKKKVGPIEKETSYMQGGFINEIRPYPAADKLLEEYVVATGRSFRA